MLQQDHTIMVEGIRRVISSNFWQAENITYYYVRRSSMGSVGGEGHRNWLRHMTTFPTQV